MCTELDEPAAPIAPGLHIPLSTPESEASCTELSAIPKHPSHPLYWMSSLLSLNFQCFKSNIKMRAGTNAETRGSLGTRADPRTDRHSKPECFVPQNKKACITAKARRDAGFFDYKWNLRWISVQSAFPSKNSRNARKTMEAPKLMADGMTTRTAPVRIRIKQTIPRTQSITRYKI